ncbi:hypothetical protein [Clostridium sporogenes]|uniref:hypothetical protein n=1 Tax=Clostridium sporogenes TaxID=1509 RepID=UPI003DA43350
MKFNILYICHKYIHHVEDNKKEWKVIKQPPKSKSSIRSVPITNNLIKLFDKQSKIKKAYKLKWNNYYSNTDYVLTTNTGLPIYTHVMPAQKTYATENLNDLFL